MGSFSDLYTLVKICDFFFSKSIVIKQDYQEKTHTGEHVNSANLIWCWGVETAPSVGLFVLLQHWPTSIKLFQIWQMSWGGLQDISIALKMYMKI